MLLASVLRLAVLLVSALLSFWFLCYTRSPQQALLCHSFCYVVCCSTTTQSSKAMQAPPPLCLNTCSHRLLSLPVLAAGFLPLAVAVRMSRRFRSISDTPAHGLCAVPVQSCRTAPFLHFRFPGSADLYVHSRPVHQFAKTLMSLAYHSPLAVSSIPHKSNRPNRHIKHQHHADNCYHHDQQSPQLPHPLLFLFQYAVYTAQLPFLVCNQFLV